MQAHHYLGALPKIGETLWYVASYRSEWVALLSFSAAAWKCAVRDRWIGWDYRHQYDRLNLVANNSRCLILPDWHYRNLGSKTLALCQRRLPGDWQQHFGHPLVLLETFVAPERFQGTVYRAANGSSLGYNQGFRRTRQGYGATAHAPKKVFVKPLRTDARTVLSRPCLDSHYRIGAPKILLTADPMRSLPDFFIAIPDPRRAQGRRHPWPTVLAIAAGAILCCRSGYKAIADWANHLGPKARERFRCRRAKGIGRVPSESIIRDGLIRVDPEALDRALHQWNATYGLADDRLAIDAHGNQTHIMSVVGHQSKAYYTQKK